MPQLQASSVEQLLALLQDSWNRHDMTAYTAQFTQDAYYVNALGTEWRGRTEIEDGHVRMHRTVFHESTITRMDRRLQTVAPGVVVCVADWEMVGSNPPPGWKMQHPRQGKLTLVLVQSETGWRIAAGQNTEKIDLALPSA